MTDQRREHPRVSLPCSVRYRPTGERRAAWSLGVMTNLSATGLRLTSEQPLEPGTALEIRISLPSRQSPYQFDGQVMWERERVAGSMDYGVVFLDPTPDQRAELDELVRFLLNH